MDLIPPADGTFWCKLSNEAVVVITSITCKIHSAARGTTGVSITLTPEQAKNMMLIKTVIHAFESRGYVAKLMPVRQLEVKWVR
jgi:hypothetical protein